jgi:two-component system phosphate regulon sensor histidine kinase PhoR
LNRQAILFAFISAAFVSGILILGNLVFAGDGINAVYFNGNILLFSGSFLATAVIVMFCYHLIVGRKIKQIQTMLGTDKEVVDTSLTGLEGKIKSILKERKDELEKIEKLERHRREYLGNVSHELKTPLFHIQGYVSTLADNPMDDKELYRHYLERTESSVERLIHILEDLDTITQLESQEISEDMEPFDVVELCKEVVESEEINASRKNIQVKLEVEQDKMAALGDRFRIRQVLLNLVVNSIRYGKTEGETIIRVNNGGNLIHIEVADNGIGIGAEHLPRLFERFYRVDKGRSREQGGTGLGLSIVKHILEAHHQTIKVESKPGEGSTFSFNLKKAPHYSSFS